ncbi:kinesin-like protein klp-3 isoform X2 [Ostrea edulis]|uniref:kinesin-like protein klp-3 isoform X2 n=1 Tax=Ostrea edulis TaxID=37623 RepID=UPI0020954E86|nr:kinesin-like protein klp-3 isoform X2 [Ostrea edulis]XP_048738989.1 kinesin-like protein klp-3 isoform X2 [Ostrea edulis]
MGNGASADESPNAIRVQATPTPRDNRNQNGGPPERSRRKGGGFQEVEIQPSSQNNTPRQGGRSQNSVKQGQSSEGRNQRQNQPGGSTQRQGQNPGGSTPRQQTNQRGSSQPSAQEETSREDLIFETFYHKSGKEFQCMYLDGMRFYLDDWGSKEWQPFPKRWYNEGLLITNSVVKDQENENRRRQQQQQQSSSGAGASGSRPQQPGYQQQSGSGQDDREGVINHPKRGRIPTYIFQRKHNIHCFYDRDQGQWMRLPIGWELHHDMVGKLVDQVEEALPAWGDRQDILALLRQCNYDPDECMSTYLYLEGDPWLKAPKTHKEAKAVEEKDESIEKLRMQLKEAEETLKQERIARVEAEKLVKEQEEKITDLEVENKQQEAQMMSLQQNRPKTSMQRPKTPQVVTEVVKEETVNPEDIVLLNNTAKELRKSQVHLKMEVQRYFDVLRGQIAKAKDGVKNIKSSSSGSQEEMEEVRALYRKEAMQRKLLYNQLQELRGNIRVFCRARKDDRAGCCLKFPTDSDIVTIDNNQQKKMFSFDKVYDPNSTQEQIFEDTKGIITSCVDGYNVCLMAYGQTGSGKTFTMMGPENNPGINIRAMKELFDVCKERTDTVTYTLKVSLIEIYNETLQDLLTSDAKSLELRTAGNKVSIPHLKEVVIRNLDDIKKTMAQGDKNRTVASTKMNSTSSRSHLLLMLIVEGQDKVTGSVTKGTLTLCDLAGSERISKTEAEGQRLVEAAAINKSLSALGQVFTALRTSQLHVPYRNSKLTQILQPSLGGDAKACLFVNVSPDVNNVSETVSTLNFGSNAKQIALGQAKQNIRKGP